MAIKPIETYTVHSHRNNKTYVLKKFSEDKLVLYEVVEPANSGKKPRLKKIQEKIYTKYQIIRHTNAQKDKYTRPLIRHSIVPRMDRLSRVDGSLFYIKEQGATEDIDFLMSGTISKKGFISEVKKMRNGFIQNVRIENGVRIESKPHPIVFDLWETKYSRVSALAKRYLKKYAQTILEKIK